MTDLACLDMPGSGAKFLGIPEGQASEEHQHLFWHIADDPIRDTDKAYAILKAAGCETEPPNTGPKLYSDSMAIANDRSFCGRVVDSGWDARLQTHMYVIKCKAGGHRDHYITSIVPETLLEAPLMKTEQMFSIVLPKAINDGQPWWVECIYIGVLETDARFGYQYNIEFHKDYSGNFTEHWWSGARLKEVMDWAKGFGGLDGPRDIQ